MVLAAHFVVKVTTAVFEPLGCLDLSFQGYYHRIGADLCYIPYPTLLHFI
jgi:hypothetical protein